MDKWVKLHIRKQFINLAVHILNAFLPEREPINPQTKILESVYTKMMRAYEVEAYCGRFDDVPYQTMNALKDKNFLRLMGFSKKLLIYLGDVDRYYRMWLGLFMILVQAELNQQQEWLGPSEAMHLINQQWDYGLPESDVTFLTYFAEHQEMALQTVLANHLTNLVTLTLNRGEKYNDRNAIDRP